MHDVLLTVSEAAEVLRISKTYVYELANRGALPVVRLGRRVLIHRESLNAWIANQADHT